MRSNRCLVTLESSLIGLSLTLVRCVGLLLPNQLVNLLRK